ncbi:MAG: hypothetical protein K9M97_00745 [Akkermansiaceae bacterium]|nr:hypothetical protein [Akkermansiaceae bacterium]
MEGNIHENGKLAWGKGKMARFTHQVNNYFSFHFHFTRHCGGNEGGALLAEEGDAGLDFCDGAVGGDGEAEAFCRDGGLFFRWRIVLSVADCSFGGGMAIGMTEVRS